MVKIESLLKRNPEKNFPPNPDLRSTPTVTPPSTSPADATPQDDRDHIEVVEVEIIENNHDMSTSSTEEFLPEANEEMLDLNCQAQTIQLN